ncbi:aldo/keto reductase [Chitinophaga flava]|uniref:Aldo/keto reductase n=1 Tax=Chitinophaga flava TaxID=2259036 RepID=A0A365XVI6_9BACT|nr:aldo/keto reductase [Chitinophaga flava]RBL90108.1 aldo/keto reductase [Chitinophaga flava]
MDTKRIVLGTAGLGGVWGTVDERTAVHTILQALASGITAIDTAPAYGDAEYYVGKALQQWKGPLPTISTKVGRLRSYAADEGHYDYSTTGMIKSVHNSLKTLGLFAVDILFLHDPEAVPSQEADRVVAVLQDLKQKGLTQKIGLGGNIPVWFEHHIKAGVFDVIMEFNRLNACNVAALQDRLPCCNERNIDYFAASPLNMGLLGKNFQRWQQAPPQWLHTGAITVAQRLQQIATENHLALPALAHRFLLNVPYDFSIVIGASDSTELESTLASLRQGELPASVYRDILECNNR